MCVRKRERNLGKRETGRKGSRECVCVKEREKLG